jgi:drug/metabolite transporter (DMT)-like permease
MMKAAISIVILALVLNVKLKHVMYDTIDPESKWALAFKSTQTCVSIFISYNAMKYFSVSTTGVVCSLTPLIACLLAVLFLKEKLSKWTIISVLIVLSCVMMIIFGSTGEEEEAMNSNKLAIIALCFQPLLLAGGMIAARKMKKNHPMAQTCYSNLLLGIMSVIGIKCYDHIDFSYIPELSLWSWVLISLAGLFTIFENTAKFLAFRYEEAAKL